MMYVYITSNRKHGVPYIGVTSDLAVRTYQHKSKTPAGFTSRYNLDRLVYFEQFEDPENAIRREKQLKKYNRQWKLNLIDRLNPDWIDLYPAILGQEPFPETFHLYFNASSSAKADDPQQNQTPPQSSFSAQAENPFQHKTAGDSPPARRMTAKGENVRQGWAEAARELAATSDEPAWPEFSNADDSDLKW